MRVVPPRGLTLARPERRLRPSSGYLFRYTSDLVDASASTSTLVAVTASGTPHTKGSWVQAIAATTSDIHAVEVHATTDVATGNTNTASLVDIGTGGSGSETVIVADIGFGHLLAGAVVEVPVFIPSGTRVALRMQSVVTSKAVTFAVRGKTRSGSSVPARYCTTYGADTSASRGTVLGVPGAADTHGAWTELTAATTERLAGLVLCPGLGGASSGQTGTRLYDVGVGGSGSEVAIIENLTASTNTNEQLLLEGDPRVFAVDIPAGTRITARFSYNTGGTQADLLVVGIPWRP